MHRQFPRHLAAPKDRSFFLFGPRGVGKTAWTRATFPNARSFDLLDGATYARFAGAPEALGDAIPRGERGPIVLDEIQRLPQLLNEVHRLIEDRKLRFVLTGSSARSLRRRGVNLLAGRASTRYLHPLTAAELGDAFSVTEAIERGGLPTAWTASDFRDYLRGYASTYLREEVLQEGLTRNLAAFARFLEAASFSQAGVLNVAAVGRECGVSTQTAMDWFGILDDLLIATRVPAFTRRAKRRIVAHPKFYFFDAGVYGAIRPRGVLEDAASIRGAALETLVLAHLRAHNDGGQLGYDISYWRTSTGAEVDFVLYGPSGLIAIEVKSSSRFRDGDAVGLRHFLADYPVARAFLVHGGGGREHHAGIDAVPAAEFLATLDATLRAGRADRA